MKPTDLNLPPGWPTRVRSAILHVVSLANFSMAGTRDWAANSPSPLLRITAERDELAEINARLEEELRVHRVRMGKIPSAERPHYPPTERMAILELRMAWGWSIVTTAERFQVSEQTITSWLRRVDEEGPDAIVQARAPVNKYPDFVGYVVRRLKELCPHLGKKKIAQFLARAGLHLSTSTVGRMAKRKPKPDLPKNEKRAYRNWPAKAPNHHWNVDITTVPMSGGLTVSWFPKVLPLRAPHAWRVAAVIDRYSRRVLGIEVFPKVPTSKQMRKFLDRVMKQEGAKPKVIITDQGKQFDCKAFRKWAKKHDIDPRLGAVNKYGSVAMIERFFRTLKTECTRKLAIISRRRADFLKELELYVAWYNDLRPHESLKGKTPNELYFRQHSKVHQPRWEPRARWPRRSKSAAPQAPMKGRAGVELKVVVSHYEGRRHLPVVGVVKAAA